MIGCSGAQNDANPSSSAFLATTAGSAEDSVASIKTPTCMVTSFSFEARVGPISLKGRVQEKIESGKCHQCCCDGLQQIEPVQNLGIHTARQGEAGQGMEKGPCYRKAECHHGTDPHPRSDGLKKKKEGSCNTLTHKQKVL